MNRISRLIEIIATENDILHAIQRAIDEYSDKQQMLKMIQYGMQIDHSWESVVHAYKSVYESI